MPSQDEIKKLEEALAEARDSLRAEQGVGGKTDAQGDATPETPANPTPDLRALIAEEVRNAVGAKSEQAQQRVDMAALIKEAVAETLKTQQTASEPESGQDIKAIVSEVLAEYKSPRKTPLSQPENTDERGGGSKGGGTYIPQHKLGEKANLNTFLCAAGRKDRSTIHDIQSEFGVVGYGGRALVEGQGGALDTVAGPSGGFLVPPEFMQDVIPLLYPYVVMRQAGAQVYTMRSPQFFRPRMAAGGSATYVGETAAIPSSQQTFDQFSLLAKELTALVPISRLLVEDSDPAVEQIVRADMARQIGLKEDATFLFGAGSSTVPQGILSRSDIQIIPPTDGTNGDDIVYDDLVDIEVALDVANVPDVNRVWIAHPKMRAPLLKLKDKNDRPLLQLYDSPQEGTLWPGRPNGAAPPRATLMGRPFYTSTQVPTATQGSNLTSSLSLVEMSEVVIGQLGGMEVATSDEGSFVDGMAHTVSAFQSNLTLFRIITRHDINIYHPEAAVTRQSVAYALSGS